MKLCLYSISKWLAHIEGAFRLAKDLGISSIQVFARKTTTADQLLQWEQKYGVRVAIIDERFTWNKSGLEVARSEYDFWKELGFATVLWPLLFGRGDQVMIPDLILQMKRREQFRENPHGLPWWMIHPDVVFQMGEDSFAYWIRQGLVPVVENERPKKDYPLTLTDPRTIATRFRPLGCKIALDIRHVFITQRIRKDLGHKPIPGPIELCLETRPEVIHLNWGEYLAYGRLPEQAIKEWKSVFAEHQPDYLVLETGLSPRPKKALKDLLHELKPLLINTPPGKIYGESLVA